MVLIAVVGITVLPLSFSYHKLIAWLAPGGENAAVPTAAALTTTATADIVSPPEQNARPTSPPLATQPGVAPSSAPGLSTPGTTSGPGLEETPTAATASSAPLASDAGWLLVGGVPRPAASEWPSNTSSTAWMAADGYHLFARQNQRFAALSVTPSGLQLRDVLVSATFHKTGGPAGGGYGIIVRDQGPPPRDGLNQGGSYYVLEVGDVGLVGIWRREEDRWVEIMGWTPSTAVHPGLSTNTLLVTAAGQELTLSVNGIEVARQTDAALTRGGVGVFVGGDQHQAVLTDLKVESND